jgi:hypothetical protein
VMLWTLFNAYGHICMTKAFDKWRVAGLAIYQGFSSVNVIESSCSQTSVGAQWEVAPYRGSAVNGFIFKG